MHDVEIEVKGSHVMIDFTQSGMTNETLADRADEILPLLYALLSADNSWLQLSDGETSSRARGYLAIDMMCQAAIQEAKRRAELMKAIADGVESIADHGFPEFEGGQNGDI